MADLVILYSLYMGKNKHKHKHTLHKCISTMYTSLLGSNDLERRKEGDQLGVGVLI